MVTSMTSQCWRRNWKKLVYNWGLAFYVQTLRLAYKQYLRSEMISLVKKTTGKKKMKKNENNPKSFSLINLHKHMLGCKPTMSHGAEADCFALLRITAVLGKNWLGWLKKSCRLFSDCEKMWSWGWKRFILFWLEKKMRCRLENNWKPRKKVKKMKNK